MHKISWQSLFNSISWWSESMYTHFKNSCTYVQIKVPKTNRGRFCLPQLKYPQTLSRESFSGSFHNFNHVGSVKQKR